MDEILFWKKKKKKDDIKCQYNKKHTNTWIAFDSRCRADPVLSNAGNELGLLMSKPRTLKPKKLRHPTALNSCIYGPLLLYAKIVKRKGRNATNAKFGLYRRKEPLLGVAPYESRCRLSGGPSPPGPPLISTCILGMEGCCS